MENQWLTPNIVYQVDVSSNVDNEKRVYLGVSETPFKEIYSNHARDRKHGRYNNASELPKYIWELKPNIRVPIKNWKIAKKVYVNHKDNLCRLCLIENLLAIIFPNQGVLLNKRSGFISKCRHENILLIVNMK